MKELILLLLSKHKNNSASNTSSTGLLSPETHSVAKEVVMQHSGKDAPVPVFLKLFVTSNSKLLFSNQISQLRFFVLFSVKHRFCMIYRSSVSALIYV